jgi:hypothetical protein
MSNQKFTPGKKSQAGKIIKYLSLANINNINIKPIVCESYTDEFKKFSSQSITPNISNAQRVSQILRRNIGGGNTHFGNYYLGEPVVFNYLGRVEGQPGGSGAPLRNRF